MRPVLTAAQMREADRRTIEEVGLPGARLEALETQERVEPNQPAARAVQPVHLEG